MESDPVNPVVLVMLFSVRIRMRSRTRRFTKSVTIESGGHDSGLKISELYLRANRAAWICIKQVMAILKFKV